MNKMFIPISFVVRLTLVDEKNISLDHLSASYLPDDTVNIQAESQVGLDEHMKSLLAATK